MALKVCDSMVVVVVIIYLVSVGNNGCLSTPIVMLELWREHVHFTDTLKLSVSRRTNASMDGAKRVDHKEF